VGVVVDKAFMPYKITFRYWSSTPFSWSLHGLPDALVKTLRPHFASVEPLEVDQRISPQRHDRIARMTVDQLHFDGANTTGRRDRVDLTMTFVVEQPNGREVFRTTVAANASSPYRQPCRRLASASPILGKRLWTSSPQSSPSYLKRSMGLISVAEAHELISYGTNPIAALRLL